MNTTTAAEQANVSTGTIRRWCRIGRIAAAKVAGRWVIESLPTTAEEAPVELVHGYTENVGPHQIMLIAKTNRRMGTVRWSYVIDEHIDSIPDTTKATAEEALDMARTALGVGGGATRTCMGCSKPATMTASLGPTCADHYDTYAD